MLFGIILFLCIISSAFSQIPLGSKLTVTEFNFWVSPNGLFSLGFFNLSDQPDRRGVGVLVNGLDGETAVVWSAGAAVTVADDSYLHLTLDGDLVLFDSSERTIAWKSNTTNSSVFCGELHDNGNFVLLSRDRYPVWQSFSTPSDTLLPGQSLSAGQTLRAAARNSVASYYTFSPDESGEAKLSWESNVTYWRSNTENLSSSPPYSAVFSLNGSLQLLDRSSNPVWSIFGNDHGDSSVILRFIRLDVDGNLRMYSLTKKSKILDSVWQAVENQCEVFATCGLRGLCFFNPSGLASCKCPFGRHPSSSSSSSCLAPYEHGCSHGAAMVTLKNTFLYGVYPPEEASSRLSMEECRKSCMQDPSCTSITTTNDGEARCLMKKTPFVTGYQDPSLSSTSLVKICLDPLAVVLPEFSPPPPSSPATRGSSRVCKNCLAAAASAAFLSLFLLQVFLAVRFMRWRKKRKKKRAEEFSGDFSSSSVGLIPLSFTEIKNLSNEFKNKLGPDSYRGTLPGKKAVVIRELMGVDDRHFRRWISLLGNVHHRNLSKVEGFCRKSDDGRSFLAIEFYKNGSVDRWREDARLRRKLSWNKRMDIFRGVARALSYLHSECREFIPHGNLSWRNVVLDGNLQAKVTDYGLSKLRNGEGSAEEDVARFGEMVAVLVTGKEEVASAYRQWRKAVLGEVLDSAIEGVAEEEEVERALRIAFWCVQPDRRLRPSMGEVARVLEGSLPVDPPPVLGDWESTTFQLEDIDVVVDCSKMVNLLTF